MARSVMRVCRSACLAALVVLLGNPSLHAQDSATVFFARGHEFLLQGTAVNATWELEAGLQIEPDNAYARYLLGDAFWRLGQRALAKEQFRLSLGLSGATELGQMTRRRLDQLSWPEGVDGEGRPLTIAGMEFRDCSDCPVMVVLEGGEYTPDREIVEAKGLRFRPGDAEVLPSADDSQEPPPRRVRVERFAIGKHEVTQGQWRALMGSNPSSVKACGDECPVETVNWDDAQAFIRKLNEKVWGSAQGPYRLPSASEWEYACLGGVDEGKYCGGDDVDALAWTRGNSETRLHPVGRKRANRFGLHDMSGSVQEWVDGCPDEAYEGTPPPLPAERCSARVMRGGSREESFEKARWNAFEVYWRGTRMGDFGFRVAMTIPR
jgi:formylglycine-generating enzyme required for sulfatase activity